MRPRTGPRYQPRSFLISPGDFGRTPAPGFVPETAENSTEVAGAIAQHTLVFKIRCALDAHEMTVVDLAARTGLNYQRLSRVFRGTALLRIEDIGLISRILPEAFDFQLGTKDRPFLTSGAARLRHAAETMRTALAELEKDGLIQPASTTAQEDQADPATKGNGP